MSHDIVIQNSKDRHGDPICPVCDRAIRPGVNVVRRETFMVHLDCVIPTSPVRQTPPDEKRRTA